MPNPLPEMPFRVGYGYDLHRLEPRPPQGKGRQLILGGVAFADNLNGPVSHSDGDAVYHAVTDALLGALGMPDIGELFPDDDPKWRDTDSSGFIREAVNRMAVAGFAVGNLDITVICETPKVSPHKQQMIANLAAMLDCHSSQVNIKGKTHEKVDAIGEGRAVEVHAVVLLMKA